MNHNNFKLFLVLSLIILNAATLFGQNNPISLYQENPHYFSYKGKPKILVTSGEHYGAVMNPDFDYKTYLKTLQKDGLNLTRTMSGAYFEPTGAFKIEKNTMAPDPSKYLCPFERIKEGKDKPESYKFNLEKWDEAYFIRLKKFIAEAQKRNVIVELTLFCPFYEEMQWVLSPFNIKNNINNLGNIKRTEVYTLDKNGELLYVQKKMVEKIVNELRDFPNLIYEICNEPYFGGITLEWQEYISKVIAETERSFTHKHLISQNIANGSKKIDNPNPLVSVFNFHYASPPTAVTLNFNLNKVIGNNETGFNGQKDSTFRKEAWEFFLAGGGLFNNLDYSFTTEHPKGTFQYPVDQPGGGSPNLRRQLGFLKKFIESFNFVAMQPNNSVLAGCKPNHLNPFILCETGKQYAFYVMGGKKIEVQITLPNGKYKSEWFDPVNGKILKKESFNHAGGISNLVSPGYTEDIALRILNVHSR